MLSPWKVAVYLREKVNLFYFGKKGQDGQWTLAHSDNNDRHANNIAVASHHGILTTHIARIAGQHAKYHLDTTNTNNRTSKLTWAPEPARTSLSVGTPAGGSEERHKQTVRQAQLCWRSHFPPITRCSSATGNESCELFTASRRHRLIPRQLLMTILYFCYAEISSVGQALSSCFLSQSPSSVGH